MAPSVKDLPTQLWVLLVVKTALPSYCKAEELILRQRGTEHGLGTLQLLPRTVFLGQPQRSEGQTDVGWLQCEMSPPRCLSAPRLFLAPRLGVWVQSGDPKAKQEGFSGPRAAWVPPVPAHLCVSREHLDSLRGDKQIHLRHGLRLSLRCLWNEASRRGHCGCDSTGSLPHSQEVPLCRFRVLPQQGQYGGGCDPLPSRTLILSTASWACAMRTLVGGFLSDSSCVEPRYFAPKMTPSSSSSGSQGPGTEAAGGTKQRQVVPPLKTRGTNSY